MLVKPLRLPILHLLRLPSLSRVYSVPLKQNPIFISTILPIKRSFSQSSPNYNFKPNHIADTDNLKKKLIAQGAFNQEQAETIITIITNSLNEGVSEITSTLSTREDLIKLAYMQRMDFTKLRDELLLLDKNEFHKINAEQERLGHELDKLGRKLREEITKCNAGFKLDLSLEKGRIKEEASMHDLQIKEVDTRIDQEVTNMKMQIDSVKAQVMQWLIGVCTGTFALVLAYIRLLS
ncbi:Fmp32p SCDLUD_000859 [Saccharomycodes ludwigii]|uniref:Fmp32p n=1 Tax=Saccharomycodes ludwigii TaxID=36035 RepID=UPI001E8715DC|nr:hypothetical protein SCDLUD_000859 [Saccharomycodes ludwigii]KAH3903238.1 hypothetical protein SCDLUD_000859 [Saccharomycodes ludwigii]